MLRLRLFDVAALAMAFALAVPGHSRPARSQTGPGVEVTVRVSDATGAVIDGATLVMTRGTTERRARTGADGVARLRALDAGEWTLEVRKEGFAVVQQTVTLAGAPATVEVALDLPVFAETVNVQARLGALDTTATSATRLELSLRELPATLNVVTQETIRERGANFATEAIEAAGGTVASDGLGGQLPGYQTRGFTGNSIMHDGIRQNSSVQSSRPIDTFLLDRVEVLKGPASLLAGEGGTAGTVNYVTKAPRPRLGVESLLSYGTFGSRVGVGVTGPLGDRLSGRVDASYSDSSVHAKPSDQKLRAVAGSLSWTPTNFLTIQPRAKYSDDDIFAYYATPLIDGKVDPRMRTINYNMRDGLSRAHNNFGRVDVDMSLPGGWRLRNATFAATQRMDYRNMESYRFDPATGKVVVRGFFLIWRNDLLVGNQFDVRKTVDVLGRSVNLIAGFELQQNDMQRAHFDRPLASTIEFRVDPFNPEPIHDPGLPYLRVPDVLVNSRIFYAEAQARLASRWTTVLGLRWERINVDYDNGNGNRKYYPVTGRAGVVYSATENVSWYASYSRSIEPATQFVSLSGCCGNATFFNLTPGRQYETGVKGTGFSGRLEGSMAYFDIEKQNIPTRTLVNDEPTDQLVGRQVSRGVEFSVLARPTASFTLTGDLAFTDAEFADFNEIISGVNVSRDGNTPTNVPAVVWNLTPMQRIGPISIAANVRRVGSRWGDTANTRRMPSYTTLDSWVSFLLPRDTRLTLRGRNLTDALYIPRLGTTSGRVGLPRSFEASLTMGF